MILCPLIYRFPVEWDLTVAARVALVSQGLRHWQVSFSGLYATLKGPKSEAALARRIVEKVPGVAKVTIEETNEPATNAGLQPGESPRELKSDGMQTGFVQLIRHEERIYVRGFYPTSSLRDTILASARKTFRGLPVINEGTIVAKQEMGWPKELPQILPILENVHDLELSAGGDALILGGKVVFPQEREAVVALVKGYLPLGVTLENNLQLTGQSASARPLPTPTKLTPLQRQQEQAKLDTVVRSGKVLFRSASSRLPEESYEYLDRIAAVLRTEIKAMVIIGGHTDDKGDAESNRLLSQKRADAVRAYLITRGISIQRLFAKGYGQVRPLNANDDETSRQRNRRTTFDIL